MTSEELRADQCGAGATMTTIAEARAQLDKVRQEYADQMDHVAKFARADCDQVRDGLSPDGLAGAILQRALSTYRLVRLAEKALDRVRAGR